MSGFATVESIGGYAAGGAPFIARFRSLNDRARGFSISATLIR